MLHEGRRDPDPALAVELRLRGAGVEVALELPRLLRERVELAQARLDRLRPVGARVRVKAAVEAAAHDDSLREGLPEAGGQGEAALVIDGVLELAEKHSGAGVGTYHFPPR